MANTFELISSVTVGSGWASSIDFTSIPSTFTDLVIKSSTRADGGFIAVQFNGDTGANYSSRFIRGNGSTAASNTTTTFVAGVTNDPSYTANTFANSELYIPNYAVSGIAKSGSSDGVMENNGTAGYNVFNASLWTGTAAITSIKLFSAVNFVQYSTAYLYGVKNA